MDRELVVRAAEVTDRDDLIKLMLEYIVDFYKAPQPSPDKLDSLLNMLFDRSQGIQFVAEVNHRLVGFATLYFTFSTLRASKAALMNDLYVAEEYRGAGVAQHLFQECQRYALGNGFASMFWETATDNFRAQRFYEKMGGHLDGSLVYSIAELPK